MSTEDPAVKVCRVSLLDSLEGREVGVKVWPDLLTELLTEDRGARGRERLEELEEKEGVAGPGQCCHESCRRDRGLLCSLIQIFTRTEARPDQASTAVARLA